MCDFCGDPGDHNKPYEVGREDLVVLRLVPAELHALTRLRTHVRDVQLRGYDQGPAAGDVQADAES
ncbi:MAG TPA: hypothetical protein VGJ60_07835 [Chloroflexota bacterium]